MLNYLEQIYNADTIDEVWDVVCDKMASYGFGRLLYAYTRFNVGSRLSDPLDSLILSSHSADYMEGYVENGHYTHGPMLRWLLENTGACSWGWMSELALEEAFTIGEKSAVEFNRAMGVVAGYTIGFRSDSPRNRGGIGLAADEGISQDKADEIWARSGREILAMNNMAHLKIISLPYSSARRALTDRQREVLEWVSEGKTMQDIATIMGLTSATIEKHLRLARESLDVDTTAQAVLKASFQSQIFVVKN